MARAYPNGRAPDQIQQAADRMWELAARASRLEGELASHSRKLEAIERRGRALRAEIGRKVEELAGEESRALREATSEREHADRLVQHKMQTERELAVAQQRADAALAAGGNVAVIRKAFEDVGIARGRIETLSLVARDYEKRAGEREQYGAGLRKQIEDLRSQLQRYSEALENDLQAGRDRIATRVREALGYEKSFTEASSLLVGHLKGRPECREVLDEVAEWAGGSERVAAGESRPVGG